MKILVFGAGVLGSLYAARLQKSGNDVTILARGTRLDEIRTTGIVLQNRDTRKYLTAPVRVIGQVDPQEAYDLVMVLVRKNQLESALETLSKGVNAPTVLFMVNTATGPDRMIETVGRERVLLGFPGAGGSRSSRIVQYSIAPWWAQPTTLGELDGQVSERVRDICSMLIAAGFPTVIRPNMDAWLKTHVAIVSPVANALYLAGGDNYRLARTRDGVTLMVRAIRENLKVLEMLNVPIVPFRMRILKVVPEPALVGLLQFGLRWKNSELMLARHANAARDEMKQLADEFRALARRTSLTTPASDWLYTYIEPETPTMEEGRSRMPLDWRPVVIGLGAVVAGIWMMRGAKKKK